MPTTWSSSASFRCNQLDVAFENQLYLKGSGVPGLVGNQSGRKVRNESSVESSVRENGIVSISSCNSDVPSM